MATDGVPQARVAREVAFTSDDPEVSRLFRPASDLVSEKPEVVCAVLKRRRSQDQKRIPAGLHVAQRTLQELQRELEAVFFRSERQVLLPHILRDVPSG